MYAAGNAAHGRARAGPSCAAASPTQTCITAYELLGGRLQSVEAAEGFKQRCHKLHPLSTFFGAAPAVPDGVAPTGDDSA